MVEIIQHLQRTQTQTEGPSTSMEGWNTTQSGILITTFIKTQKSQEVVDSQEKLIVKEESFQDICKQMLEISYDFILGQLLKIAPKLKSYFWQKLKADKILNLNITTINKQVISLVSKVAIVAVIINNHMVIIQVQIGKNTIDDVLLDGGFGVNIITEQLRLRLRLPKLKLPPYNLRMVDQTTTKLVGLIKDLRIYVHDIFYITTFPIFQNNVVDLVIPCCWGDHG